MKLNPEYSEAIYELAFADNSGGLLKPPFPRRFKTLPDMETWKDDKLFGKWMVENSVPPYLGE